MATKISQTDLVKEYFQNNPNRDIEHPEVVDWVVEEWKKRTGEVFRDPDRAIRSLSQRGFLIKIKKGVYKYDPDFVINRELEDFTPEQKQAILERDNYECARCGARAEEGVELHIDHIKSKDMSGEATIENGQILCSKCNFIKKNYNQSTFGKRMFINLHRQAKKIGDVGVANFCVDILKVYDKHNMNGHIKWKA